MSPVRLSEVQAAAVASILTEELETELPDDFATRLADGEETIHRFEIPADELRTGEWRLNLWTARYERPSPFHLWPPNDAAVPTARIWQQVRRAEQRLDALYHDQILPALAGQSPGLRLRPSAVAA